MMSRKALSDAQRLRKPHLLAITHALAG